MKLMVRKHIWKISSFCLVAVLAIAGLSTGKVFAACSITVSNTNDSGAGSFRQAITSANAVSNLDTICFSIGSGYRTISPTSVLPQITQPVIIDGTSQPGFSDVPLIEINGSGAGVGSSGIQVNSGASGSTIKGIIVNRFGNDGIILFGGGNNTVVGNYVGTSSGGTADLGNGSSGIGTLNSSNNTIGGTTAADRNVVSGNQGAGISIGGSSNGNVIEGNYVGTTYLGQSPVGNTVDGILIAGGAANNVVGGTSGVTPGGNCTGACNLVSGNGANGVGIGQASGNQVKGNYVGVDFKGTNTIPNGDIGVEAQDAANTAIGGSTPAERNIMSGNHGAGVSVNGTGSTGVVVSGNFIGVDVSGSVPMGNLKMGINIGSPSGGSNNASSNTIGGTSGVGDGGSCTGACNVIAANGQNGIYISGATGGSNQIIGNFIGNSVSGGLTLPNVLDGVGIVDSSNNRIGGPGESYRNIISGNGGFGVAIVGGANGTRMERNYIGIATDRNVMPNQRGGIGLGGGVDHAILTNSIFGNGFMGIDVGNDGWSANDGGDPDGGPNRHQNYPSLSSVVPSGGNAIVGGSINSLPGTMFYLEFFESPTCNSLRAGYGQGKHFLGSMYLVTDGAGNRSFNATVGGLASSSMVVTATATKMFNGNMYETSEFSNCTGQPTPHPDGALIKPSGSNNIFIIDNGHTRAIGSVEVLRSYNIPTSAFKTATGADTGLPGSPSLYFREGTLLKGSGPDVFVIDQVSQYGYTKRKITSIDAFVQLGYTQADIISVPDSALGLSDGAHLGVGTQHPDGALVIGNGSPAVYMVENGKKRLVGSNGVLISQRITSSQIKPATSADLGLPVGDNLGYKEGTLLKGSGPNVYFADDVDVGGGTIVSKKRLVSSAGVFSELGYAPGDVQNIPDSDLNTLPDGPAI